MSRHSRPAAALMVPLIGGEAGGGRYGNGNLDGEMSTPPSRPGDRLVDTGPRDAQEREAMY